MFDVELKRKFRKEFCNIVEMSKSKVAIIPKGTNVLLPLQSDEEFEKLLSVENWAVTQTIQSNILFFDSDPKDSNDFNEKLSSFFNRRRDKYIENSVQVNSQHGFLKVTDVDHKWCIEFAKKYKIKSGIEIYAEKHWVIFAGTYYNEHNLDDQKRETTWYPLDDAHNEPVMEFTKENLGLVFSKISTDKKPDVQVLSGEGLRHEALISLGFKEAKTLVKKREILNSDSLYQKLINSDMIEGMKDYEKGNGKYQELESIIEFVIDHVESDASFGQDYLQSKNENRFAHVLGGEVKDQFNTWYWDTKKWSENTAHFVLQKLLPLKSEEFKPSDSMALKISHNISASEKTLMIDFESEEYKTRARKIITNDSGQYYDLEKNVIREVDPSCDFFTTATLKIKMEECDEPTLFFEFLDEIFEPRDKEILLDHLAGGFVHAKYLNAKRKTLECQGPHDTWKSLIIEIMKEGFNNDKFSEQPFEKIENRNFGKSMVMNRFWNFQEEKKAKRINETKDTKEIVTQVDGKCEVKGGRKEVFVDRWPTHLTVCNKVSPIPLDDDDESILIRMQYIQTKKVSSKKDWRDELIKPQEIQKIFMWLLNRASEIQTKEKPIKMQSLHETRERYTDLVESSLKGLLLENFIITGVSDMVGTSTDYVHSLINEKSKNTYSKEALFSQLDEIGFPKRERVWCYITNEANVYTEDRPDESAPKFQRNLIIGLKPIIISSSANAMKTPPRKNSGMRTTDNI